VRVSNGPTDAAASYPPARIFGDRSMWGELASVVKLAKRSKHHAFCKYTERLPKYAVLQSPATSKGAAVLPFSGFGYSPPINLKTTTNRRFAGLPECLSRSCQRVLRRQTYGIGRSITRDRKRGKRPAGSSTYPRGSGQVSSLWANPSLGARPRSVHKVR
jgi:hypothetical protein